MAGPSRDEKAIFLAALEKVTPQERNAFVEGACAGDPELLERVRELLASHDESVGPLDSPPPGVDATIEQPITEKPGTVIGPYKLLQKIGEGGFGVVYMADQTEPVKRRVALKIIKPGMDTRQVIARFEAERQALAMMDHPNIAKVLDAGTTDSGWPYFVMDLVKGVPITQYCDERHLTPRERLELFVPVCQAIQHAHQKGVIHRDIKPTNILVAEYDDRAVPKIIDFGVAKAIDQRLSERTVFTQLGQVVGTIDYMSPEQAKLNQLDIDTRSDIYSLGVVLYELLTGETPFDRQRLRSAAFDELLRIIREEEPPKPSLRLSTSGSLPSIAANRKIEPKKLSTLVRGELDWIVMKALEKDRVRRYETATGFANDIQRYLNDEPVVACPPSTVYRLRKFLRRNRLPIATTPAVAAVITVAVWLGVTAHRRGLREAEFRRLAEIAEREKAEAELDALVEEGLRLSSGLHPDFKAAVDRFTHILKARPEESSLYLFRGSAYYQWGKPSEALVDSERALALSPEDNFAAHYLIAVAAQELGDHEKAARHRHLAQQQRPESVEALVAQALALQFDERAFDMINRAIEKRPFDPLLYSLRGRIGSDLALELGKAEYYQRAKRDLEMSLTARPNDDRIRVSLFTLLMWAQQAADNPAASREEAREFAEEWVKLAPESTEALNALMTAYNHSGQAKKSLTLLSEEKLNGPLPWYVVAEVGNAHRISGNYEKSLDLYDRAIEGGGSEGVYLCRAISYAKLGKREPACQDIEDALNHVPRTLSPFAITEMVSGVYEALGDDQAVIRTLDARLRKVPGDATALSLRAKAYARLGQNEKALADHDKAIQLDPKSFWVFHARGDCNREIGNVEAAFADYDRAIQRGSTSHWTFFYRGECQRKLGNLEAAYADYDRAIQLGSTSHWTFFHRGECQHKLGNLQAAIADYEEAIRLARNDPRVLNLVAWRLATIPDSRLQDSDRAVELAQKAVELSPKQSAIWNTLGVAQYRAGEWETAIESLEKSMELGSGGNSFDWFFLAMAHWHLRQKGEARRWYDQSIEWMEENKPDDKTLRRFRTEAAGLLGLPEAQPEEEEKGESPTTKESGSDDEASPRVEPAPSQP